MSRVDEFYRVPLTSGEVLATLATLKAVARLTDTQRRVDTELEPGILTAAVERIARETPDFLNGQADRLADAVFRDFLAAFVRGEGEPTDDGEEGRSEPPFPIGRTRRLLEDAFERREEVEIEYFVRSRNEWTTRHVHISDVFQEADGSWRVAGRCGLRDDYRQFRLDHIRTVRVREESEPPDPFEEE